jgi:glycosyltransferase involved in cell wall biosynthesis
MKSPAVSVIVTSFNSGDTLGLCLQSLRNQDINYKMEVIIVDDCSEDSRDPAISKKTVESDERFKYVRHPSNKGTAQARRTGVKMSKGKFVGFLDADDYALPCYYSTLLKGTSKNLKRA